jgi:hypothetical protein
MNGPLVSVNPLTRPEERLGFIGPGQGLSKTGTLEVGSCSKSALCADPPTALIGGSGTCDFCCREVAGEGRVHCRWAGFEISGRR